MRRLSVALAFISLAMVGSAQAADMAVKAMPVKAPVVDPVWMWTGFYVGANGGYSWSRWGNTGASTANPSINGALGGVQAGYNWQLNASWVVGLEGDIQGTGERGREGAGGTTVTDVAGGPAPFVDPAAFHTITTTTFANQWQFPAFGTFRGRIGGLVDPTTLLYATGGLAVGDFTFSSQSTANAQTFRGVVGTTTNPLAGTATTTVGTAFSQSVIRAGYAVGAGIEKKFTRNWSGKLEYLYLGFGSNTFLAGTPNATSVSLHDNIIRVGINYQFDPPVVARY